MVPELPPIKRLFAINQIAVLVCHGGYFSGAIFNRKQVIAHKTFHHYVTRRKQGGRQSTRDKSGRRPKSGGAAIRRYNEDKHQIEIRNLMSNWATLLENVDIVFVHLPGGNRADFFAGDKEHSENPDGKLVYNDNGVFFHKDDARVRKIPFTTRRASYSHVREIFAQLTTVTVKTKIESDLPSIPLRVSIEESDFAKLNSSISSSSEFVIKPVDDPEEEPEDQSGDDTEEDEQSFELDSDEDSEPEQ